MAKDNRTLEHLSDNLDEELAWRKKELSILKKEIPTKESSKQAAFIRAGITMLYAHWEGFVKKAAENYIQYVKLRRLNLNELKPCFIARIIRGKANEQSKIYQEITRVEFILEELENRAHIPEIPISTKSNLWFDRFEDILTEIGLEISDLETILNPVIVEEIKKEIDKLVTNRNQIAHGKYLPITLKSFNTSFQLTMKALNTFKIILYEAAQAEKYKR